MLRPKLPDQMEEIHQNREQKMWKHRNQEEEIRDLEDRSTRTNVKIILKAEKVRERGEETGEGRGGVGRGEEREKRKKESRKILRTRPESSD